MTGKMINRATRDPPSKEGSVSKREPNRDIEEMYKGRRNGNRSIVRSFFSPDSSAISRVRREANYEDTLKENIKIDQNVKDDNILKEDESQLKMNLAAKVGILVI